MNHIIDAHAVSARWPWPLARLLVFTIGLAALLSDSLHLQQPRFLNLHLLFGVVLLAVVARRLFKESQASAEGGVQFYHYTHQLVRQVYILLYLLAAVRLCLNGIEAAAAGTGGLIGYMDKRGSLEDFHVYIIYGVVAACVIRACGMFRFAGTRRMQR